MSVGAVVNPPKHLPAFSADRDSLAGSSRADSVAIALGLPLLRPRASASGIEEIRYQVEGSTTPQELVRLVRKGKQVEGVLIQY